MNPIYITAAGIAGLIIGFVLTRFFGIGTSASSVIDEAQAEARTILASTKKEAKEIITTAEIEGKETSLKMTQKLEKELDQKRSEAKAREAQTKKAKSRVEQLEKEIKRRTKQLENRQASLSKKQEESENLLAKATALENQANRKLEQVAGMSIEQAKEELEKALRAEARSAVAPQVQAIEKEALATANSRSKEILATAIQRYASEFVQERTVSVVPLPSDDLKGRLIGREGRNIRALEAATGVDMIIDDTSGVITISCFNPVRREIARLAISKLVSDGRIHPTRIEEIVNKAGKEVDRLCREAGDQAVFDLGLHQMQKDLVVQLGRLKYRSSYAQNLLQHSVEVGFLAGLMASEIGIDEGPAKRAGLLHDIGKSIDHEQEGSHAEVGAKFARKCGESEAVCRAIRSHHGDVPPRSVLEHIVDAANQVSAARPGARREQLASYVKRLSDLESIATSFSGVHKAFALQAGREVRVMVENDKVSDLDASMLSKDIAKEIENRSAYPGSIRVVVVRETRASDYAQ